jgi:hypothetical protein
MSLFEREFERERSIIGFKNKRRSVYTRKRQTGTSSKKRDESRESRPPGKRISKFGNEYYEYRKNRSDIVGSKT